MNSICVIKLQLEEVDVSKKNIWNFAFGISFITLTKSSQDFQQWMHFPQNFEDADDSLYNFQSDESSTLTCSCGDSYTTVTMPLEVDKAKEMYNFSSYRQLMSSDFPSQWPGVSYLLQNCAMCKVSLIECDGDPQDISKYRCLEREATFKIDEKNLNVRNSTDPFFFQTFQSDAKLYPKLVNIPMGKSDRRKRSPHRRNRKKGRNMGGTNQCTYPTSLDTAEIDCLVYPSKMICRQRCALGYTLGFSKGIEQQMKCNKRHTGWKPRDFEECQPYVDCSVSLTSGGNAACMTADLYNWPTCDITCLKYEDKPGSRSSHECDDTGRWKPRLPFCAARGSGLQLAERPRKTYHEADGGNAPNGNRKGGRAKPEKANNQNGYRGREVDYYGMVPDYNTGNGIVNYDVLELGAIEVPDINKRNIKKRNAFHENVDNSTDNVELLLKHRYIVEKNDHKQQDPFVVASGSLGVDYFCYSLEISLIQLLFLRYVK